MNRKLFVFKSILTMLLCIMIVWDAVLLLTHHITEQHKQMLFVSFLCWFITIMSYRSSDDDWAGQY